MTCDLFGFLFIYLFFTENKCTYLQSYLPKELTPNPIITSQDVTHKF